MPNHDRFECQTAIDSDAILQRLSQEVTERFYVCTDPGCGLVFKTLQTINRFIVRPVTPDELAESLHEKQELPPVRLKTQSYSLRLE